MRCVSPRSIFSHSAAVMILGSRSCGNIRSVPLSLVPRKSCHRETAPCFARLHRRRCDRSLGAASGIRRFPDRDLVVVIRNLRARPFLIGPGVQRLGHATGLRQYAFGRSSHSVGDVSGRIHLRRPLPESSAHTDARAVRISGSTIKRHTVGTPMDFEYGTSGDFGRPCKSSVKEKHTLPGAPVRAAFFRRQRTYMNDWPQAISFIGRGRH